MLTEQNEEKIDTRDKLAAIAGVSNGTMAKVEKIEAAATAETKQRLSAGDETINNAYKQIREQVQRRDSFLHGRQRLRPEPANGR